MTHLENGGAPTPSGVPVKDVDGSTTSRRQGGDTSSNLPSMIIFVFGSNLAGRHGRGAALAAVKHHKAKYGQGVGLQGNAYAIPTKDENLRILPLDIVKKHIEDFIGFAAAHPKMTFNVTEVGCGLACPVGQTREERISDIASLFADALEPWSIDRKGVSYNGLENVNLPKAFQGTRDIVTDKDGEEVASADASATRPSDSSNLSGMVINNNNTTNDGSVIDDESVVELHHTGWTDADGVGATTPTIESMETVCSLCGFCAPQGDGYCQNKETGPHLSQWGKRRKTMIMNNDIIYGQGDKAFFKLDTVSGMSSREKQLESKLHLNDSGDLIRGLNLGEKTYRRQATPEEIAKADNTHIHKFGCPCVKCTCGFIVEFDENGDPTGATASDTKGYGGSFELPRNNLFQKSEKDTFSEVEKYINSNGIKGIDPERADYMLRIENRRFIANASIEYAPANEWLQVHSNKKHSHNGGFTTKTKEVIPKRVRSKNATCTPYHKLGWDIDNCSCNERKQPTIFYTNIVSGVPDEAGTVNETTNFLPESNPNARIPHGALTMLRTSFGSIEPYTPEREVYENYSYVIPTLLSFITGEKMKLHMTDSPRGTKEELESGAPRLVGTVKGKCPCEKSGKLWCKDPSTVSDKFPEGINFQCDCKYEDLPIADGDWNTTHVSSSDPVKGHAASLGDVERKKVWYHKWYMQGKEPHIPYICPEDSDTCWHGECKWYYSKKNPLSPNYPTETTGWQRNFCKERGVILPDNYTYDQSFKIVSYLFKDKIDVAKEIIALHASHVEHQKQHIEPFPMFEICEECNAIYTHQDESVDSETGKVSKENNSIHYITDDVPYQESVSAVKFDNDGKYIRRTDIQLAIVGSSEFHKDGKVHWKEAPARAKIVEIITAAKEACGDKLVVMSGGALGVDTIAEQVAIELEVRTNIYRPDVNQWDDGEWNKALGRIEIGYKTRDLRIANRCHKLVCIVGGAPKKPRFYKGRTRRVMCKHCNLPHYSSGGCYTAKKAFWVGKDTETIAV